MTRRAPPMQDLFGPVPEPEFDNQVRRSDLVDLELRRVADRDTDKAFCVQKAAASAPVYLPRTLTELHGPVFTFPRWMAVEKGLL